jgi:hypothetical protein
MAGLFLGATCQVSGTTAAIWQLLALLSFVGPLPVLWVGLRDGFSSACTASGVAVGFVLTLKALFGAPYNLMIFLPQVLMILALVKYALLSRTTETGSKEWYPSGHILAYLIGIALCALLIQVTFDSGPLYPDEMLRSIAKEFATSSTIEEQMYETLKLVVGFYPALTMISNLILVVGNAGFAQKLLERIQQNIRPIGAFSQVSLPGYYLWFVAGAAALTVIDWGGSVGPNLLLLLSIAFFLVGLSLVHEMGRLYKLGTITLVVFYVVMIAFGWLAALVSIIGLFEPWLRTHPKMVENK